MANPLGRLTLKQLGQAVRDLTGQVDAALSADLPDQQDANRKWALYTIINQYVQGLRSRVQHRLQQEGISALAGYRLYFDFWRNNDASVSVSGATVWLPTDCDRLVRPELLDTSTNRKIYVVADPGLWRYATGVSMVAVPAGHQLNGTESATNLQQKLTLYPSTVTPTLTADYYRLPKAMDESSATSAYPDLPPVYQDCVKFGVAADILENSGPSSTYEDLRRSETQIFQSMIREGAWL